jgi:uncharacterized protein YndB with AHSA1/START domain
MSDASAPRSTFIYVIFIRTTPERLWTALTSPEWTRQYWFGMNQESNWQPGAPWRLVFPDGRIADTGEILEIDPPRRLVLKWRNEFRPELKAEGYSRCSIELEPVSGAVKLSITHSLEKQGAELITAVSGGWPRILSNLKSLLETGQLAFQDG